MYMLFDFGIQEGF